MDLRGGEPPDQSLLCLLGASTNAALAVVADLWLEW